MRSVQFGIFEVDLRTGELRRNGVKVKIQEQPFQVLAALLERPGEIVTRDELQKQLWPADTFVDFDHSINAAIRRLRDALDDSAESPIFVETVARRGYRFIAPVEQQRPTNDLPSMDDRPYRESFHVRSWQSVLKKKNAALSALVMCALALLVFYYGRSFRGKLKQPVIVPALTNIGEKYTPSLSPDGQHLAFSWNGGSGPHFSLYVKIIGTEESHRLTEGNSIDFDPAWSPDGRYIAFCRISKGESGIYVIPAMGGAERRLRSTLWEEQEFYEIVWYAGRLAWSSDGNYLAFSDRASRDERVLSIFLMSLESLEARKLTSPLPSAVADAHESSSQEPTLAFVSLRSRGDVNPEFSPDGKTLAFARVSRGVQSIYTVPISGGPEQHLISGRAFNWGLAWTADGRNIVFGNAGWMATDASLWRISAHGGQPERLPFGEEGVQPSIRGRRLAYVQQRANLSIWTRTLDSSRKAGSPHRLIASTRMESGPQFSPDGSRIAFESTRSGNYEVWVCQRNGTGLIQLTRFNSHTGTPRWSANGQQIAFDSRAAGNADIYVVGADGGPVRRLTSEPSGDVVPSWSRDGHWIYFASDRSGSWEIWKMPSSGGRAAQVTRHGGFAPFESSDGRFVYYAKGTTTPGIWRIPTSGGEEDEVIGSLEAGYWGYWALVDDGIYYLDTTAEPGITFFDLKTHRRSRALGLENPPAREGPGLALSPDQKTILYTQIDGLTSDVILVDNFQ
jgi:Tol biopolymer transport system component/DNA-binding winged helix-turn-helix (wHTH) protein